MWLSKYCGWKVHFWNLFWAFFFWPGFSVSCYIFTSITCRIEWLERMSQCSQWDQQETILLSNCCSQLD